MSSKTRRRGGPAVALTLLLAPAAAGHDMWIVPPDVAEAGDLIAVRLRVGHAGTDEPVRRDARRIVRFTASGAGVEVPVTGLDGAEVSYFRPSEPGLWALAYESTTATSRLPAARFTAYLEHEGLDEILRLRRQRGQEGEPGRELYSRSLKSLAPVGGAAAAGYGQLGLPLELVAEALPEAADTAETVVFRLMLRGEPLAGALVDVRHLDHTRPHSAGRTDAEGRVSFRLGPGSWLAAAIHMEAAESPEADWRSLFHTLTFVIPDRASAAGRSATD